MYAFETAALTAAGSADGVDVGVGLAVIEEDGCSNGEGDEGDGLEVAGLGDTGGLVDIDVLGEELGDADGGTVVAIGLSSFGEHAAAAASNRTTANHRATGAGVYMRFPRLTLALPGCARRH